jgi:hypothetical protein
MDGFIDPGTVLRFAWMWRLRERERGIEKERERERGRDRERERCVYFEAQWDPLIIRPIIVGAQ